MNRVYKYECPSRNPFALKLPVGAKLRHFGTDLDNQPCLWAEVDPEVETELRTFHTFFTGDCVPPGAKYVGTTAARGLVIHLYET